MAIDLQMITDQYKGTTLAKLIEYQIKNMKLDVLDNAIQGTYQKFQPELRRSIDEYTHTYPEKWFNGVGFSTDLSSVFAEAIDDAKGFAKKNGYTLSDDDCFNVFNLTVMRISYFAHQNDSFRKKLGIKKGWFS